MHIFTTLAFPRVEVSSYFSQIFWIFYNNNCQVRWAVIVVHIPDSGLLETITESQIKVGTILATYTSISYPDFAYLPVKTEVFFASHSSANMNNNQITQPVF